MLDNWRTQLKQFSDQQKIAKQVANSWICFYIWQYQTSQIKRLTFTDHMKKSNKNNGQLWLNFPKIIILKALKYKTVKSSEGTKKEAERWN